MTWHLRQVRRRRVEQEQRWLLVNTAAGCGGKAAEKLWRMLEKERQRLSGQVEPERGDGSEIPLSQEDFQRMMNEDT